MGAVGFTVSVGGGGGGGDTTVTDTVPEGSDRLPAASTATTR